eukprot:7376363-Prymnesium_polylepis.1
MRSASSDDGSRPSASSNDESPDKSAKSAKSANDEILRSLEPSGLAAQPRLSNAAKSSVSEGTGSPCSLWPPLALSFEPARGLERVSATVREGGTQHPEKRSGTAREHIAGNDRSERRQALWHQNRPAALANAFSLRLAPLERRHGPAPGWVAGTGEYRIDRRAG